MITGITGQDGAYLAKFLIQKGYKVFGTHRRLSTPNFWRLHYLDIYDKIELIPADMLDSISVFEALKKSDPQEVYHLAAQSYVATSFEQPIYTFDITGLGVIRILNEIRRFNKTIKFYQAGSSEMYGAEKSMIKDVSRFFSNAFKPPIKLRFQIEICTNMQIYTRSICPRRRAAMEWC